MYCNWSLRSVPCVGSSRNFQLLSFGEEAEEDEREVTEVAEVHNFVPVNFIFTSQLPLLLSLVVVIFMMNN